MVKLRSIVITLFLAAIILTGCGRNYPHSNEIVVREGLLYKKGSSVAFTGRVIDTLYNKVMEYDVVKGMKKGEFILYYPNGIVQIYGKINNNKYDGRWSYFYSNGQVEAEGIFVNDSADSSWVWYYRDGKVKEKGGFSNGKRDGLWISFDEDGNIIEKVIFIKDEKVNEVKAALKKSS